jgi:putative transposase
MSYIKIIVHSVWGTKHRSPLLIRDKREILFDHVLKNARLKQIYIDTIGGYTDHVHSLISFGAEQSIAKVIQLIKGESSFWANQNKLFESKFQWADDYYAKSISESHLQKVRNYILNQEEHHRKISFLEEYNNFMKGLDPWS